MIRDVSPITMTTTQQQLLALLFLDVATRGSSSSSKTMELDS